MMSIHQRTHPAPQPDCFGCKVASLNWGVVPGAFKDTNSGSMFDRDQLLTQLGGADGEAVFSKERVEDKRSDFLRHQKEFLDA